MSASCRGFGAGLTLGETDRYERMGTNRFEPDIGGSADSPLRVGFPSFATMLPDGRDAPVPDARQGGRILNVQRRLLETVSSDTLFTYKLKFDREVCFF